MLGALWIRFLEEEEEKHNKKPKHEAKEALSNRIHEKNWCIVCACKLKHIAHIAGWLARSDIYPSLSDRHQWLNSRISLRLSFTEPVVKRITSQQHTLANQKIALCVLFGVCRLDIFIYTHSSNTKTTQQANIQCSVAAPRD